MTAAIQGIRLVARKRLTNQGGAFERGDVIPAAFWNALAYDRREMFKRSGYVTEQVVDDVRSVTK